ncbi:MAG: GIY-YIG nuclease family protein [Elusimicrobia bacterium]|nr:GIY-YIG nuclease family protein [Elusimicrobiota bacterium]
MNRHGCFCVYIVQCKNGTYYTGSTKNLENRLKQHNSGRGAKYLRGKGPVELVYCREFKYYKNALNAEREIKTFNRHQKEKFIQSYEKNN